MTPDPPSSRLAGVIELGSTSVRMAVGQWRGGRHAFELLDQLVLPVGLGRDSFTQEVLSSENIERCVDAVRGFSDICQKEYGLTPADIRVVATSAVREARNREQFSDRLLIGAGYRVEVLDEAEVSRLTYLAVRPQLRRQAFFRHGHTLVMEVGGGSTDILFFRKGRVIASQAFRLGSLRMLRELGDVQAIPRAPLQVMGDYVDQVIEQIVQTMEVQDPPHIIVLGSEARLLCGTERIAADSEALATISIGDIARALRQWVRLPIEDLARLHGITLHQAETLTYALFINASVARALGARELNVSNVSMRHGVLTEQLRGGAWAEEFRRQTISSATALARHYRVDLRHARQVAHFARRILHAMRPRAVFTEHDDVLITVAALLHEIGMFVHSRAYHKHSLYLIQHSEIFGLGSRDTQLVGHIVRYHRRTSPRPDHELYLALPGEERIRVAKLAAILRVADCLPPQHGVKTPALEIDVRGDELHIRLVTDADLTLPRRQIAMVGEMFQNVFGLRVMLRHAVHALDPNHETRRE